MEFLGNFALIFLEMSSGICTNFHQEFSSEIHPRIVLRIYPVTFSRFFFANVCSFFSWNPARNFLLKKHSRKFAREFLHTFKNSLGNFPRNLSRILQHLFQECIGIYLHEFSRKFLHKILQKFL